MMKGSALYVLLLSFLFVSVPAHAFYVYVPNLAANSKIRIVTPSGVALVRPSQAVIASGGVAVDVVTGLSIPLSQYNGFLPPLPVSGNNVNAALLAPVPPVGGAGGAVFVPPQDWFTLFDPLVASGVFSLGFMLMALSGVAGHAVGSMIRMLGYRH